MGSPLGPILANIFVGFHEERLFQNINKPIIYFRYVDDTFALFTCREDAISFLQSLNNLHPALQFTHEEEVDNCIPFLDVLVERVGSNFLTSVYRKPTFTGEYVPWGSFCPSRRKINLIACLTTRAVKICSPAKLDSEVKKILEIFTKLGYPEPTVSNTIKKVLENRAKLPVEGPKKCSIRIRLPYIGPVSSRFDKQLVNIVEKTFPSVKLQVIFTTKAPFSGFTKDSSPPHDKNNTVYRFRCHCESEYVGMSTQ